MDLNEILVFTRVVQLGSFTLAATQLGMPKSTVSRKVSELEDRLNARLLQRTTRRLSLTDVGRTYYEHCTRIVAEVEDAERAVSSLQDTPRGLLRVTVGQNAAYLATIIAEYLKRYPEVRLEILCTGRSVDLIDERFDVGIRAGTLEDSSLVARSLGRISWFLVATPAYLKKRGRPRLPRDLMKHDYLFFGTGLDQAGQMGLRLGRNGNDEHVHISLSPRMTINEIDILHRAAAAGTGIALLPAFQCVDDLRAHRLARVLPDWSAPATPIQIIYPTTRHVSPKVTSFVEHLQKFMTPPPWELGPMPS